MALPWLIAGAVIGVVADELLSDDKKELQTSTDRKQISASDVPADIRTQIEGSPTITNENFYNDYEKAHNYYYGLNGFQQNKSKAKGLYLRAAQNGNYEAKMQLKKIWGIDY